MMFGPCRYISRRFEQYAGTQLMLGIFGTHNRARVSVASFAHGPADGSNERERITRDSDVFMDVSSLSPSAVAEAVRQQRVDVLVDYDGAHQFNNLLVLAHRPAPVQARLYARSSATAQSRSTWHWQVTYLGFAGTVGACPTVDFQISDAWVVPAEIAPQHCERLVRAAATRPRLIGGRVCMSHEA
jgi:predicted O-linked N-acetylglucosamine transferase (SPINDLY family)